MEKLNKGLAIAVILLSALCWALGGKSCQDIRRCFDTVSVRVDSFTRVDTIVKHDTVPMVRTEKIVRYVPKKDVLGDKVDSVAGCSQDSLPIVQKEYSDDSTYTAYVSGIRYGDWPRLDSINTYTRTVTHTVTKTITVREQESPFDVGLQAGYGYGFQYKGFEPYVGIGLTYRFNLFKRKKKPH